MQEQNADAYALLAVQSSRVPSCRLLTARSCDQQYWRLTGCAAQFQLLHSQAKSSASVHAVCVRRPRQPKLCGWLGRAVHATQLIQGRRKGLPLRYRRPAAASCATAAPPTSPALPPPRRRQGTSSAHLRPVAANGSPLPPSPAHRRPAAPGDLPCATAAPPPAAATRPALRRPAPAQPPPGSRTSPPSSR